MQQLNESQLAKFKAQLETQQSQIRLTISAIFDNSDHASHHLAVKNLARLTTDQLIEFSQKVTIPDLTINIEKLKKLDASIISIELDMYGLCSDCESNLAIELLNQEPTTQRCPVCEEKYQKQRYNNYRL